MAHAHNAFVWYELMTTDADAARGFYRSVFGWDARPAGVPGIDYTLLAASGHDVAGLFPLPPEVRDAGGPPCWLGYVGSADVDADVERVVAAGGSVHKQPTDIPGIGRFAVVADPHGAVFQLFRGNLQEKPEDLPEWTPGLIGWHELHAGDGTAAFAFYSSLFGWTEDSVMDMGPLGVYRLFAVGGKAVGGMMTRTPDTPHPLWLYYVCVKDVDAAIARATAGGGKLLMGPHEVPGGAWIAQLLDPQGALFAMVGGRGDVG